MRRFPTISRGAFLSSVFFALYAFTVQRGVSWQDSGALQLRAVHNDLLGSEGLALAHPLYIRIGHLFCLVAQHAFGMEAPFALNLASAFWMALALGFAYRAALRLSRSRSAATLATLALGLSHMAWWLSTVAEVYTLSLFFLAGEVFFVLDAMESGRKGRWALVFLFSGLGASVHNLAFLSLPLAAVALILSRPSSFRTPFPCLLWASCWCAGAYWLLRPFAANLVCGMPFPAALADLLVGGYGAQASGASGVSAKLTLANLGIAAFSLLSPIWIAAVRHLAVRRAATPSSSSGDAGEGATALATHRRARLYAVALFVVHFLFFLHYRVADQALFLLPTLFCASLLASIPLARVRHPRTLAALAAVAAVAVPLCVNGLLHRPSLQQRILASRARLLPFRDEVRYWTLPWKHDECSADLFALAAIARMDVLGEGSLYADSTSAPPIMLRLEWRSIPWQLFTPWEDASRFAAVAAAGGAVYAVSPVPGYCPGEALATHNVKRLFE